MNLSSSVEDRRSPYRIECRIAEGSQQALARDQVESRFSLNAASRRRLSDRWNLSQRKGRPVEPHYSIRNGPQPADNAMEKTMTVLMKLAAALLVVGVAATADAAEFEVKMLNKGAKGIMVFEPDLLKLTPGDSVRFIPTDKGHNVETIKGMTPDGATSFIGKMNEEILVTFDKAGLYGIRCKPHYGLGMVGLIVVGDPANIAEASQVKHPGKAKKVFADLFTALGTIAAASN
jgi:pseudoazurin